MGNQRNHGSSRPTLQGRGRGPLSITAPSTMRSRITSAGGIKKPTSQPRTGISSALTARPSSTARRSSTFPLTWPSCSGVRSRSPPGFTRSGPTSVRNWHSLPPSRSFTVLSPPTRGVRPRGPRATFYMAKDGLLR